jgi:hypothetical protein
MENQCYHSFKLNNISKFLFCTKCYLQMNFESIEVQTHLNQHNNLAGMRIELHKEDDEIETEMNAYKEV